MSTEKLYSVERCAITVLCLSICAMGVYWLDKDFRQDDIPTHTTPFGRVESVSGYLKRKLSTSLLWNPIEKNSAIYLRDLVQTGPESQAIIKLHDTVVVEMGERSLVRIDEADKLEAQFLEGSFVVHEKGADKLIEVKPDGSRKVQPLRLRLTSPTDHIHLSVPEAEKATVDFAWTISGKAEQEFTLEIAHNRRFVQSTRLGSFKNAERGYTAMLDPGVYYWRVRGKDNQSSTVRRLTVSSAKIGTPLSPEDGKTVYLFGTTPVLFRWNSSDREDQVTLKTLLEIATDPQFHHPVTSKTVSLDAGMARVEPLPSGTYFWRLNTHFSNTSRQTQPLRFMLSTQKDDLEITPVFPKSNDALKDDKPVRLSWISEEGISRYRVRLSNRSGQELWTADSVSNHVVWPQPTAGDFQWQVEAEADNKIVGKSPACPFSVFDAKPLVLLEPSEEPLLFWQTPEPFQFRWDKIGKASQYVLEISRDRRFQELSIEKKTPLLSVSSTDLPLGTGRFFWRVKAFSDAHTPLKTSDARAIVLDHFPKLVAPAIAQHDTDWDLLKEKKYPRLQWTPVPHAVSYEVLLFKENQLVSKFKAQNPWIDLSVVRPGRYQWRVCAMDPLERCGEYSISARLQIQRQSLRAPTVLTPEVDD